ncbi:MAG: hypothetical protein ACTHU0_11190 [Kofleriaceae bacterium]
MALWMLAGLAAAGCSDDEIDSDEQARRAYYGLDDSIEQSITLGFAGFNSAQSANISPQMGAGLVGGTLVITGQVDQGASNNKGMRLRVGMTDYTNGPLIINGEVIETAITYDTDPSPELQPALLLQLKDIPTGTATGTLTGTLMGTYQMSGLLEGEALLNLTISGAIQDDGTGKVIRAPGTTHVTGTATSGDGTYTVDVML